MKLYAAQNNSTDISFLALLETLISAIAALWLASEWMSFSPFTVCVVVAPILLLRTRDSMVVGIRIARKFVKWAEVQRLRQSFHFSTLLAFLGLLFAPQFIRIWATAVIFFRSPVECVAAFPSNWWNLVVSVDSTVAPQVVPGFHSKYTPNSSVSSDYWNFPSIVKLEILSLKSLKIRGIWPWPLHIFFIFLDILSSFILIVIMYAPALLYRWSLNSTFWIYLPLLWVVQPAHYSRETVWSRVSLIKNDKTVLVFSAVIFVLVVLKIRMWQIKYGLHGWLNETQIGQFVSVYVAPDRMPVWQYASLLNSILAFAMYFVAQGAIRSREELIPWPERSVDFGLRTATVVRRILTTYTTVVLVMITLKQGFPPLGEFLPL